jgi:hypothetical protein
MVSQLTGTAKEHSTGKGRVHHIGGDVTDGDVQVKGRRDLSQCKTTIAAKVFAECYAMDPIPPRRAILAKVMEEVELSEAGANTYYQNWRKDNGLTKK